MLFTELDLPDYILKALEKQNFTQPTEIQSTAIPLILNGRDVVGKSQTGSGKTFAYGIPAVTLCDPSVKKTEVLILSPTRELALQITDEIRKLTEFKEGCKTVPVYGGADITRQIQALKKSAKIVVGTPGRIMDHLRRKTLKLDGIKMLVLDEADEMLDMGFREDMEEIILKTNPHRQTVMFSATMPKPILEISKNYMISPEFLEMSVKNTNAAVAQKFVYTGEKDKLNALLFVMDEFKPERSLVFCNTKKMVDKLKDILGEKGYSVKGLHGDMKQAERKKVLDEMKRGGLNYLIATDVAARGIDITDVDVVLNYDLPKQTEYYTHRIGRTARAGKRGVAVTFINNRYQMSELLLTAEATGNKIEELVCAYSVSNIKKQKKQVKNGKTNGGRKTEKKDFKKGKKVRVRESFKAFNEFKNGEKTAEKYPKKEFKNKPEKGKNKGFYTPENHKKRDFENKKTRSDKHFKKEKNQFKKSK